MSTRLLWASTLAVGCGVHVWPLCAVLMLHPAVHMYPLLHVQRHGGLTFASFTHAPPAFLSQPCLPSSQG